MQCAIFHVRTTNSKAFLQIPYRDCHSIFPKILCHNWNIRSCRITDGARWFCVGSQRRQRGHFCANAFFPNFFDTNYSPSLQKKKSQNKERKKDSPVLGSICTGGMPMCAGGGDPRCSLLYIISDVNAPGCGCNGCLLPWNEKITPHELMNHHECFTMMFLKWEATCFVRTKFSSESDHPKNSSGWKQKNKKNTRFVTFCQRNAPQRTKFHIIRDLDLNIQFWRAALSYFLHKGE